MSLKSFSQLYCQPRKTRLREVITLTNRVRLHLSPNFIWRKTDAVRTHWAQSQFRKANLFKKPQKQQISMDRHTCFVTLIKAAEEFRHATHPCLASDSNTPVSTPLLLVQHRSILPLAASSEHVDTDRAITWLPWPQKEAFTCEWQTYISDPCSVIIFNSYTIFKP